MAHSLENITDKMMKMPVDYVGTQSLRNDLKCIPDKFLIKYDPPKICVVYHFKDHNEKDQYWRDLDLDITMEKQGTDLTAWLFKAHYWYFDDKIIKKEQVTKLMNQLKKEWKNRELKRRAEKEA